MNEPNFIWRYLRSLLFIFGAGLIIFSQVTPNSPLVNPTCFTFGEGSFSFSNLAFCPKILQANFFFYHWIFVWCAAFVHRRPGSTNEIALFFVALIYAIYVDEGLALGAFALFTMTAILRKMRAFTIRLHFFMELLLASLVYASVIIIKNIVLIIFLAPHFKFIEIIWLTVIFLISYPILNFVIVVLVRSRKEERLEL